MITTTASIMLPSIVLILSAVLAFFSSGGDAAAALNARQSYSTPNYQATGRASFTFDELYKLQVRFWNNFVYNNTEQASSINSTLIAPDCLGRVDVTRTFDGQELNTEYLFGLFANLKNHSSATLLGVPVSYNIIHFTANQDISTAATIVFFKNAFMDVFPVEIDSLITWNTEGQIWQYDATYRWFANLLDTTLDLIPGDDPISYLTDALATSICTTTQRYCTGNNVQYGSFDECHATLTEGKRFGKAYELGADTLMCRMVHENMVPLRPDMHCAHVGPDGGGMCVDGLGYAERVLQEYYVHAPFVPEGYESRNKSVDAW